MTEPPQTERRDLTQGELFVLAEIQHMYGRHNSEKDVFIGADDEAVLFVTDPNGTPVLSAVLTNLADMYAAGTIGSLDELRTQWLARV